MVFYNSLDIGKAKTMAFDMAMDKAKAKAKAKPMAKAMAKAMAKHQRGAGFGLSLIHI